MSESENPKDHEDGETEARRLTRMLPPGLVIGIAVVAFVLFTCFLAQAFFVPENLLVYESPVVRSGLCLALSVYMGIFFFVLYPLRIQMKHPVGDSVVKLAGPLALTLIILSILQSTFPEGQYGELFEPVKADKTRFECTYFNVAIKVESPARAERIEDEQGNLEAVFVLFPPGESKVDGTLRIKVLKKDIPVVFERGLGRFTATLQQP